ncbi:type II toxin-antitoxin system RelE family toxin [Hydrogenimonas sp.]
MKLLYSEEAVDNLRLFDPVERQLIAKKLRYLAENFDALRQTKKVRELKGTQYPDQYRYVIARKIRAIFRVDGDKLVLLILRIGRRKDVYE